jgi:hypothetical protein
MATTLVSLGSLAGAMTGATPPPVAVNATFAGASMTALSAGTNVQFNFANNGSIVVVIYNTAAAGGATWSPTLYPNASGAPSASILGVSIPLTAMVVTAGSVIGVSAILGPYGPSKFNDPNGLCWITQVTASAATSYIGVFALPGSLSGS